MTPVQTPRPSADPFDLERVARRERPHRQPLVPPPAVWAAVALGAIALVILVVVAVMSSVARVYVPDVTGMTLSDAKARFATDGLRMTQGDSRFSTSPEGTVLEQSPPVGTQVKKGDSITVIVSAGTDQVTMPDVVNLLLPAARTQLEALGLDVRVEAQNSTAASDTVLASNPAPGVTMRTGEIVRLTVAAKGTASGALLPYRLSGVTVIIDPAPVPSGSVDVPLEVARRLRSLLEASGATVRQTRSSGATTGSSPTARATKAIETTAVALIGLDVAPSGDGGVRVVFASSGAASRIESSKALAAALSEALMAASPSVTSTPDQTDVVMKSVLAPSARVLLGSVASTADVGSFRDPNWADAIARHVYTALGEMYQTR